MHSLLPMGRQMFSCILESKASVHVTSNWEEKCSNPKGLFHFSSFPWTFIHEHNVVCHGISLLSAEFISLSCVLTHFLMQLQPNPFQQELENEMALVLWKNSSAVPKTLICYQLHLGGNTGIIVMVILCAKNKAESSSFG